MSAGINFFLKKEKTLLICHDFHFVNVCVCECVTLICLSIKQMIDNVIIGFTFTTTEKKTKTNKQQQNNPDV